MCMKKRKRNEYEITQGENKDVMDPEMYLLLIHSWIWEVAIEFDLRFSTACAVIRYLRFLLCFHDQYPDIGLQTLATHSILFVSKLHEVNPMGTEDIARLSCICSPPTIRAQERQLLQHALDLSSRPLLQQWRQECVFFESFQHFIHLFAQQRYNPQHNQFPIHQRFISLFSYWFYVGVSNPLLLQSYSLKQIFMITALVAKYRSRKAAPHWRPFQPSIQTGLKGMRALHLSLFPPSFKLKLRLSETQKTENRETNQVTS